jgi:hypothetical protein
MDISDKELIQFLILDYLNASKEIGLENVDKIMFDALQSSILRYNRYKFILCFFDKLALKLFRYKRGPGWRSGKKILFRPFKYSNIILGVKKYHQPGILAHGNWDRLFAVKNFMGYIATDDLDHYLLAYLKEKNIKYLHELIREIEKKLKVARPDYIVLWNDIVPIERAIILVSKKLGIKTLEIQHGAYDSFNLETGKVADYVLVWGKYFKDLHIKQCKRNPEDIYVLGYPYSMSKNKEVESNNNYSICYLSQNLEAYDKNFFNIKIETAKKINEVCNRLGMQFIYRPHPGDNRELLKKDLLGIQFTSIGEGLEETLKKADIFISFNSTALSEATMRQKISLQLVNYPLKSDNLEKLGACHRSFKTIEELEDYIKKIAGSKNLDRFRIKFNNGYIETRYNPVGRFLEIIKEI